MKKHLHQSQPIATSGFAVEASGVNVVLPLREFNEGQSSLVEEQASAETSDAKRSFAQQNRDDEKTATGSRVRVEVNKTVAAAAVCALVTSSFSLPNCNAQISIRNEGKGIGHTLGVHPQITPEAQVSRQAMLAKFQQLKEQWENETVFASSTTQIVSHPAYLQIIEMGNAVVSSILEDLRREPKHWFHALQAITGATPTALRDVGNVKKMAEVWVQWGIDNHYLAP